MANKIVQLKDGNDNVYPVTISNIKRTSALIPKTNFTAGESNYLTVTFPTSINDTISIMAYTPSVSGTMGLQITPIYYGGNTVYIHYYAPRTIVDVTISLLVWYLE